MRYYLLIAVLFVLLVAACAPTSNNTQETPAPSPTWTITPTQPSAASPTVARTATRVVTPIPTAFVTPPPAGQPALVPILMYHHLADLAKNSSELDLTWTVSPSNFDAQMSWLAAQGFHTVTFPQLVAFFKRGQPLPSRPVIITFDDGWEEGYTVAFRSLVKHNFVGTFYVYTNALGHGAFLTWPQLQEMSAAGMEIGSHTLTHPHLVEIGAEAASKEIADSKALLEKRLNVKVTTFAYPFGQYDSGTVELVKRAGFESAVTISSGYKQRADEMFTLHRNRVTYETTLPEFSKLLP